MLGIPKSFKPCWKTARGKRKPGVYVFGARPPAGRQQGRQLCAASSHNQGTTFQGKNLQFFFPGGAGPIVLEGEGVDKGYVMTITRTTDTQNKYSTT